MTITSQSLTSDALLAAELTALRRENVTLSVKLAEAAGALKRMTSCFQPFAARPIGAPGSEAREMQDEQIEAHRRAAIVLAILKTPKAPPAGASGAT